MVNFLTYYKVTNPNVYALMVSMLLAIWYNGIAGLINYYWPVRGPFISLIFLILPLIIFLSDDGKLDELVSVPNITFPINSAAVASIPQGQQSQQNIQHFTAINKNRQQN